MTQRRMVIAGVLAASVLMLFASAFTAAGIWIGTNLNSTQPGPITLHADSASRSESLSFATGYIDDGVEGLWVLDHQTGDVQCWVINRQTGDIGAIYAANVAAEMGLQKAGDADYVMTTGRFDFGAQARIGNKKPVGCICYVGDGNSGKVIGLSFHLLPMTLAGGQTGVLSVVCRGVTREGSMIRDQ